MITAKPAMRDRFKTGHMSHARDLNLFYPMSLRLGKLFRARPTGGITGFGFLSLEVFVLGLPVAGAQPPRGSGRSPEATHFASLAISGGDGGLGAPTARTAFEHMPVVKQSIQHRRDRRHIPQQFSPVFDRTV